MIAIDRVALADFVAALDEHAANARMLATAARAWLGNDEHARAEPAQEYPERSGPVQLARLPAPEGDAGGGVLRMDSRRDVGVQPAAPTTHSPASPAPDLPPARSAGAAASAVDTSLKLGPATPRPPARLSGELGPRQAALLEYLTQCAERGVVTPTNREMAAAMGTKFVADVPRAMRTLAQRGFVVLHGTRHRKAVEIAATGKRTAAPDPSRAAPRWNGRDTTGKVYRFLVERAAAGGLTPTLAEIVAASGASKAGNIGNFLRRLEDRGEIRQIGLRADKVIEIVATGARTVARGRPVRAKPPTERRGGGLREPRKPEQSSNGGRHAAAPQGPASSSSPIGPRAAAVSPAAPLPPAEPKPNAPKFTPARKHLTNAEKRAALLRPKPQPVTDDEIAAFLARGGKITRADEPVIAEGGETRPVY